MLFKLKSILMMSLCSLLLSSCQPKSDCDRIQFSTHQMIKALLAFDKNLSDDILIIDEYVGINELFENDIIELKNDGYTQLQCPFVTSESFTFTSFEDDNWDNKIILFSRPFYNKNSNSIAIINTFRCGNDCGSIDLLILKKQKAQWEIVESKNLGQI